MQLITAHERKAADSPHCATLIYLLLHNVRGGGRAGMLEAAHFCRLLLSVATEIVIMGQKQSYKYDIYPRKGNVDVTDSY